jgi:ABC-type multidrug transport system fused ATPase/permease subunit
VLKSYHWRFVAVALFGLLIVFLDIVSAFVVAGIFLTSDTGVVLSLPLLGELKNPLASLPRHTATIYGLMALVCMQVLREGALLGNELFCNRIGILVGTELRTRISHLALRSHYSQITSQKRNDLILYGTTFASGVGGFTIELARLFGTFFVVLFYGLTAFVAEPFVVVCIAVMASIILVLTNRILLGLEGLSKSARDLDLKYHEDIQDSIFGLRDLTLYVRRNVFLERVVEKIETIKNIQWYITIRRAIFSPLQRSIAITLVGLIAILFVVFSPSDASVVEYERVVFVLFILLRIYGPLSQLNSTRSSLLARVGVVESIVEFVEQTGEKTFGLYPNSSNIDPIKPSAQHLESGPKITFKSIGFAYPNATKLALDAVSAEIPSGKITAIVGPIASGKSTLVDLLTGLWRPSAGSIWIDDQEIEDISHTIWMNEIATIQQNGYVFHASIRDNIAMFSDAVSQAEVERAAQLADFKKYIDEKEHGFDTILGGPDIPLSGGQKQRLQIARAFLTNPSLIIMDEATSAQDALSEEKVLVTIRSAFPEATILIIAHRFSAIRNADHIIVMDGGKVAEAGAPSDLLEKDGMFKQLSEAQSFSDMRRE